ncbi:Transcription initiation protein spt3 [Tulasnella sp. 330]|nr:Transcription initiation protein spt3 [Tulasnella sp. 330]KAG8884049.1 Transcription initiation protein spt3 [Tulasnella sp. 331]KAG8890513.1 Transcription initiation protein spt3 [Tulasnella sp. 332]
MSKAKPQVVEEKPAKEYRYTTEISQMMFVFGEVADPLVETVNLVEDIVRSQVLEIVLQARQLASKRGVRNIAAEDLIFLIRYDRAKVNRLRTYLSWKDVRKNAKESDTAGGAMDDVMEEGGAEPNTSKPHKMSVKLPWELTTVYSEALKTATANNPSYISGNKSDDEDEDEMEAHEDSLRRLKEADDATRHMTKEEYMHYSECRQASFTFRKSKRFRDYLNLPAHLDLRADDTVDILGFLAFEMVRSLCVGGLEVKRAYEESADVHSHPRANHSPSKRKTSDELNGKNKRRRAEEDEGDEPWGGNTTAVSMLFMPPPEARTALRPHHIMDAFGRMQRDSSHARSSGMKNWRGGLVRTRINLI